MLSLDALSCSIFVAFGSWPKRLSFFLRRLCALYTMPLRRRRTFRRRRPRRTFRRRNRHRRMSRRLALDPERKFVDQSISDAQINVTGTIFLLNGIAQGVTEQTRIGTQALIVSTHFKLRFVAGVGATAEPAPGTVRVSLVLDKQINGTILNPANVYDLTGSANAPWGNRNVFGQARYKVLWSRTLTVSESPQQARFTIFKRHRMKTRYSGAGAGVGVIQTNGLFLLVTSNHAIGATEQPLMSMVGRLRFVG